jgi:hypothetical protein
LVSKWRFDDLGIEFKYLEDIALHASERPADLSRGTRRRRSGISQKALIRDEMLATELLRDLCAIAGDRNAEIGIAYLRRASRASGQHVAGCKERTLVGMLICQSLVPDDRVKSSYSLGYPESLSAWKKITCWRLLRTVDYQQQHYFSPNKIFLKHKALLQ